MYYAIKINLEEGLVILSKSIIQETKRLSVLNFVYNVDGFCFYFSKKGRDSSGFRYKINKDTNTIHDADLANSLAHSLSLNSDWTVQARKGEIKILDKIKKERIYVIYLEKIIDGCFKNSSSFIGNNSVYPSIKSIRNLLDNYRTSNVILNPENNEIQKKRTGSARYDNVDAYIAVLSDRWTYDKDIEKQYYLGNRISKNYNTEFFILTEKKAINNNRIFNNFLCNLKYTTNLNYLFENLELIDNEVFVSYLSYSRLLNIVYEENIHIHDIDKFKTHHKRQTIRLSKFIQTVFPLITSEEVKEKTDRITYVINPGKPEIKEVKGDDIIHWYDEKTYFKELGSGDLTNSCMRQSKYAPYINFYAKNDNCSLVICTINNLLVARAVVWDCVDGSRVMDRPYIIRDQELLLLEEYRKKNNIFFIYDYKVRRSGKGYSPGSFSPEYSRKFTIDLNYLTPELKKDIYNVLNIQSVASDYGVPYLDNFTLFDVEKKQLMSYQDIGQYKKSTGNYFLCEYSGDLYHTNRQCTLIDGRKIHEGYLCYSKYHEMLVLAAETHYIDNDYILYEYCIKIQNKWVIKEHVIEVKKVEFKSAFSVGDIIKFKTNYTSVPITYIIDIPGVIHGSCNFERNMGIIVGIDYNNECYLVEYTSKDEIVRLGFYAEDLELFETKEINLKLLHQEELEYVDEIRIA